MKIFVATLLLFSSATIAGPIADYCSGVVSGEVEFEDGATYYSGLSRNIFEPLKAGNESMKALGIALEIELGSQGRQIDEDAHCWMVRYLENGEELVQWKTKVTGNTRGDYWGGRYYESKKISVEFCHINGLANGQDGFVIPCENESAELATVVVKSNESNDAPLVWAVTEHNPHMAFDFSVSEGGFLFKVDSAGMNSETGLLYAKGFELDIAGESTGRSDKVLRLHGVTAEGEKQRMHNFTRELVDDTPY